MLFVIPVQNYVQHRLRCLASVVGALISAMMHSGCVAFNVGSPETFTHVETIRELSAEPTRVVVLSGTARSTWAAGTGPAVRKSGRRNFWICANAARSLSLIVP